MSTSIVSVPSTRISSPPEKKRTGTVPIGGPKSISAVPGKSPNPGLRREQGLQVDSRAIADILKGEEKTPPLKRAAADGVTIHDTIPQIPLALIVDFITKLRGTGINVRVVVITIQA